MGKKRIVEEEKKPARLASESVAGGEGETPAVSVSTKKRLETGILHVQSTYNNTKVVLTDKKGNVYMFSSSGALGFKGAKKGTPFAAAKVGETLGVKAVLLGLKDIDVVIKGVGSGRESAIRGFISKGANISSIKDMTPVPFNGPKPKKPRRV